MMGCVVLLARLAGRRPVCALVTWSIPLLVCSLVVMLSYIRGDPLVSFSTDVPFYLRDHPSKQRYNISSCSLPC